MRDKLVRSIPRDELDGQEPLQPEDIALNVRHRRV